MHGVWSSGRTSPLAPPRVGVVERRYHVEVKNAGALRADECAEESAEWDAPRRNARREADVLRRRRVTMLSCRDERRLD